MARKFLGGLLETKAKANPAEAPIRAGGRALATAGMPMGDAGAWDMEKAVRDGYERVGMVFRCVDAIATTQSRIPIQRVQVDPKKSRNQFTVVDDPNIWRLLNFKANTYESSQQLRYRVSSTLLLSRRGAFIEKVPGKGGEIESIHLLAPGQVKPIPDPKTFVSGYQIMRGDSVIDEVDPENVIWLKVKPHPMDPYQQMTPLVAAGIASETDFLARVFNRNFLMNDGRPGMLISVRGQLGQEDAQELKARFSGGYSQAGQTSVIEADGIDIADMAVNARDMQWHEMLQGNKMDIQLAFGVPESVLGNASGRTFDNADAERENFYIDTMMPHCDAFAMGMDRLTGDENDDEVLAFDYSTVDVLQRMENRRREELRGEFDKGLITVDEYREGSGKTPFNVAGTRVLYGKANTIGIAQNDGDQAELAKITIVGGGAAPTDPAAAAEQGALMGSRAGTSEADRQRGNTQAAIAVRTRALQLAAKEGTKPDETKAIEKARDRKPVPEDKPSKKRRQRRNQDAGTRPGNQSGGPLRTRSHHPSQGLSAKTHIDHPYMGLRYKTEAMIEGMLMHWDTRQEDVVTERLWHVKSRQGTRHWLEEKKLPAKQKCKFCDEQATKRIIHSEGRAYIAVCGAHLQMGKNKAARSTPDKRADPSNIDRIESMGEGKLLFVPAETKALSSKYSVNEEEWVAAIVKSLGEFVRKAMWREAKNAAKNMQNDKVHKYTDLELDGPNPLHSLYGSEAKAEAALDPLFGSVMDIVKTAAKNQTVRLAKTIEKMDESGASMKEIESEIRKITGNRAPWRKNLAINVTTAAVEGARNMVYENAPEIYVKQWNSQHDPRTRPTHVKADNQQQEPHKKFTVGNAKLLFPCDPSGPPEEVINCRCYVTTELSDKYWDMVEKAFDEGDDDA